MFWGTPRCAASSGEIPAEQAGVGQQPQPDRRPVGREQLVELGRDPLAGQVADERGPRPDPGQRRGLDRELERRREPDGPDHPERVLLEPGLRVADGPQDAGRDVGPAAVRVDEAWRRGRLCAGRPRPSR